MSSKCDSIVIDLMWFLGEIEVSMERNTRNSRAAEPKLILRVFHALKHRRFGDVSCVRGDCNGFRAGAIGHKQSSRQSPEG